MRAFVTGGAGFVGRRVVAQLLNRGDEVVAAVRDPARAADLAAQLVADDLSDTVRLARHIHGADAVIHVAGMYRVGIPASQRSAMWEANVGTTTRVLDAAQSSGVQRIVYVSTVNVFGNTRGQVVDETYRRDLGAGFLSWYDETKYRAHEKAEQEALGGAPVVIAMPSQVYGRGDHSGVGEQLRLASEGRLPYRALDGVGLGMVHVDDLATGIVAALDRGALGESYVLSGPRTTLAEAVSTAARLANRRLPALRIPTPVLQLLAPLGGLIGQGNLREVISASAGVTYWASSARAERELGFGARDLEAGLRDTFAVR
jgi:nucleoside-diphosphate-sugar epimerase